MPTAIQRTFDPQFLLCQDRVLLLQCVDVIILLVSLLGQLDELMLLPQPELLEVVDSLRGAFYLFVQRIDLDFKWSQFLALLKQIIVARSDAYRDIIQCLMT